MLREAFPHSMPPPPRLSSSTANTNPLYVSVIDRHVSADDGAPPDWPPFWMLPVEMKTAAKVMRKDWQTCIEHFVQFYLRFPKVYIPQIAAPPNATTPVRGTHSVHCISTRRLPTTDAPPIASAARARSLQPHACTPSPPASRKRSRAADGRNLDSNSDSNSQSYSANGREQTRCGRPKRRRSEYLSRKKRIVNVATSLLSKNVTNDKDTCVETATAATLLTNKRKRAARSKALNESMFETPEMKKMDIGGVEHIESEVESYENVPHQDDMDTRRFDEEGGQDMMEVEKDTVGRKAVANDLQSIIVYSKDKEDGSKKTSSVKGCQGNEKDAHDGADIKVNDDDIGKSISTSEEQNRGSNSNEAHFDNNGKFKHGTMRKGNVMVVMKTIGYVEETSPQPFVGNFTKSEFIGRCGVFLQEKIEKCPPYDLPSAKDDVSAFFGITVPTISVRNYVERLVKYAYASSSTFVIMLIYMERMEQKEAQLRVNNHNMHRIAISALMIACKLLDDRVFSTAHYARVGGVPSAAEMITLERLFMRYIGHFLYVNDKMYEDMIERLDSLAV